MAETDQSINIEAIVQMLEELQFGEEISPIHLRLAADFAMIEEVDAHSDVLNEVEPEDFFRIIVSGKVQIQYHRPGKVGVVISSLQSGDLLGWRNLIEHGRRHTRAVAVEATTFITWKGPDIRKLCQEDHELGFAFLRQAYDYLTRQLEASQRQLLDVYAKPIH